MDRNDVLTLAGLGCLAGGLWWIYPPAALMAVGLAMMGMGIVGAWRKAKIDAQRGAQLRRGEKEGRE